MLSSKKKILGLASGHSGSECTKQSQSQSDLFLRRFREGISFLNFVERSILKLPLAKLRAVPFALQNRALFGAEKGRKGAEKRGGRGVASKGGKKEKRTRENRSAIASGFLR